MDIYKIARERTAEALERSLAVHPTLHRGEAEKARRRENNAKYARSPKGRVVNGRRCRKWAERHKEYFAAYIKKWKADFEEKHGMKYATYIYRKNHGLPVPEAV